MFIDSHAHIDATEFDDDRRAVIDRARAAGILEIVCVGAAGDLATAERTVALAEREPGFYATVGVHPHHAKEMREAWWPTLRALTERSVVVGVGETGLDYYYDTSPRDVQRRVFGAFIEFARDCDLPIVCHIRDAHDDARAILADHNAEKLSGIIHCFTGTPDDAARYVEMGLYISFSGIVTFPGKRSDPLRDAVRAVPTDRILIETDCPYLAPTPLRGKRNEPAFMVHTAEVVAREAGLELAELARITTANTRAVYRLPASDLSA